MKHFSALFIFWVILAAQPVYAFDTLSGDLVQIGRAFFTNLTAHEYGHAIVGNSVGAEGVDVTFFSKEKNNLFLGYTSTKKIDERSYPSFALGGEIGSSMSFEAALQSYRRQPTTYNKALMFFSGTDFLWYSLYTFYVNKGNPESDPNIIVRETGISKDAILAVAITQTVLNSYRVASGKDRVIHFLTFDKNSIGFRIKVLY